jgi:hypothetical protein
MVIKIVAESDVVATGVEAPTAIKLHAVQSWSLHSMS